ncbi:MAG: diaminopimelate decarboxylase [Bacteroidales bacterium]|nr:diaminopimelate decarboxylase [Bacteroidota bacterium]MBL6950110.1 diaminopimelate decarboxylase [Bacteroidales bacterium]
MNISRHQISDIVQQALKEGLVREEDTAILFQDLGYLKSRISDLISLFPPDTLHGLAIKTNPLAKILEFTRSLGVGAEAATVGEINLSLQAGFSPDKIVFDSPVKTISDLQFALKKGIHLNCDNLSELKRVNILLKEVDSSSTIGIRINPQVGFGTILESSVAGDYSKFGVPIQTNRNELTEAFLTYPWLTGVHLHVGSQGCSVEMLVEGVGILYDFALEINEQRTANGEQPITIFDIGGGLPVSYRYDHDPPRMENYVEALKVRAPGLFGGKEAWRHGGMEMNKRTSGQEDKWGLITEFGRWVFVNSGFTISRVEYVKRDPGINTAMIHVGADLFVRECLNPTDWMHEYSVLDKEGNLKEGKDEHPYNLAGPLCFAGDIVAKHVILPKVEEGDYIIIHDTGGYTFSMWSRYNSRQTPRILGIRDGVFSVLKERESFEEIARFWT